MSIATLPESIIESGPLDPRAAPLLADLIREYDSRYGPVFNPEGAKAEIYRYPPAAFEPPQGNFLLLLRGGETIAGGAFMRFDDLTAEVKRVWTRADFRRQGLAQRIMQALEDQAAAQGYTRIYLTTGFRQPEAVALYLGLGYRPLFLPELDPALYKLLPFEKHVGALAGQPGTSPLKVPSPELAQDLHAKLALKAQHDAKTPAS